MSEQVLVKTTGTVTGFHKEWLVAKVDLSCTKWGGVFVEVDNIPDAKPGDRVSLEYVLRNRFSGQSLEWRAILI